MLERCFLPFACFLLLISCEKNITTPAELIDANLNATSPNNDWERVTTQTSSYNLKTLIDGKIVNNETKLLSQKLPELQKTVSSINDTITTIILTNQEGSNMIKFEDGVFFGINTIPEEQIEIMPILSLKENSKDYSLIDSTWNNEPVFYLVSKKNSDGYVLDKHSKLLIAYLSENSYGKSILTYEDYREVDGYLLPFRKKINIPKAKYAQEFTYEERQINNVFPEDYFELKDTWKALKKGMKIPSFELPTVSDKSKIVSDIDLRGKVTLIDFWATWCKPCIEEFPTIKKLYDTYKDEGLEVVSISVDGDKKRLESFLTENPFPWTYSLYSADQFKSELAKNFQLVALPKPILIDKDGRIIAMDNELKEGSLAIILKNIFTNKDQQRYPNAKQ